MSPTQVTSHDSGSNCCKLDDGSERCSLKTEAKTRWVERCLNEIKATVAKAKEKLPHVPRLHYKQVHDDFHNEESEAEENRRNHYRTLQLRPECNILPGNPWPAGISEESAVSA
mmetsp:Transcript_132253/g.263890  ORF Transcript_132253/g.263890 Transcript_132253/m.263890 type:complete len:114 (-) Transcript_132253:84-425(-)